MELRPINYPKQMDHDFDDAAPKAPNVPLSELVACHIELKRITEARKHPPCQECGAMTEKQAEDMCNAIGDDCHGCQLWP